MDPNSAPHNTPDQERLNFSPSLRWIFPDVVFAALVAIAIRIFLYDSDVSGFSILIDTSTNPLHLYLPISLLVFLVLLARPLVLLFDSAFIIGAHHIYEVTGRISLKKKFIEVPYEDMRGVRYEQNLIERILNVGTIIAWTATAESAAILMRGIANPEEITDIIRNRIDGARLKGGRADPGQDQEDLYQRVV